MTLALVLTSVAGLSTTIGSVLGLVVRRPGPKFMGLSLGFAAGVMILVSFVELLPKAADALGFGWAHVAFFAGLALMFVVDTAVPHSYQGMEDLADGQHDSRLLRTGLLVALGVGVHNLPEGMATFAGTLANTQLGIAIAVAIAIHNIPEGLAVAAPVYAATGSRSKAFWWSFLSGVAEPVGAGIAALVLLPFLSEAVLGAVLAGVAGLMVFISLDELLPASREYGQEHLSIIGVLLGMAVMAVSLWMLTR
ncbi:MAG: zinc transporter ZupT [Armatimonadota bacterium]|nr:MAG: zinc transporter ZupT [Armatimonadota bacterium]